MLQMLRQFKPTDRTVREKFTHLNNVSKMIYNELNGGFNPSITK